MAKKRELERSCILCENGQEIYEGEYCICKIKGVMSPDGSCRHFQFDPLKLKVSVQKLPEFHPVTDL
ncbi:MAG: hypothetical protein IKJ74_00260 [Clostridia bacterium]|nr:hypothetical protein [Clostridia bacterium]